MTPVSRLRAWCCLVLLLAAASVADAQPMNATGVVTTAAPMYLAPDQTRVPLATLAVGSNVRIVAREGDWLRVVFRDRYLGDRTGYVRAANVRIEAAAAPPADNAPSIPGLVSPSTAPAPDPAQGSRAPTQIRIEQDRGYVWLSATYQDKSTAFETTTTFAQNGGTGTIATRYDGVKPLAADVAIGQRLWGGLGYQIAGTWAGQITDAAVTASVPSLLPGASPRAVSGRATQIHRQELALHVDASIAFPTQRSSRAQVVVFAGPSLFRVKQDLVTGVNVNEAPPFDTATFASAAVVESTKQHVGFNGGVEASVRVYKALGVGALVRFSRADVPFSPTPDVDITIRAGDLQVGGGLHFRF
jgi:hypothetical protein